MAVHTEITSRENDRVKQARRLATLPAARAEAGLFFAEGVRLCLDLAATLPARTVFFTRAVLDAHPEVERLADEAFLVSPGVAQKLGDTKTPQGLFCLFETPAAGLDALDPAAGVLLCEGMADPANVGAVVRSAAGLGLSGVVFTPGSADPFGPKALRASMGAVGRIPLVTGCAPQRAAEALRGGGARFYAAALQDAVPLTELTPGGPFVLMVGSEAAGLSQAALALADARVYIPMHHGVESLNAAAAATALMFYLRGH